MRSSMRRSTRRREEPADSLELLLDAVCNMFGTIVFIALVAALLAITRSGSSAEDSLLEIGQERERQLAELERLAQQLERDLERYPAPEIDGGLVESEEKVLAAAGEIARRRALIERYRETAEAAKEELENLGARIDPLRDEVKRLDAAVAAAERAKSRPLRTPFAQEVELDEFVILIWQDRLYPICDLRNRSSNRCEWLRAWHPVHTVPSSCSTPIFVCGFGGIDVQREILLRSEAGIEIGPSGALAANRAFAELVASLDRSSDLVSFVVATDSFGSFSAAKQAFLELGFSYTVAPLAETSRLPRFRDSWIDGRPQGF
jgi:hypothetical protein